MVWQTLTTCSITFSSQSRSSRRSVGERGELLLVLLRDVHHVPQPVVDEAVASAFERRPHAAAAVVPADDHVPDREHVDGVLEHRQAVEIGVDHHVRDVAVHEHLARIEADDLVGGHAAVRAADPEERRVLALREAAEVRRIIRDHRGRPRTVVRQQLVDPAHRASRLVLLAVSVQPPATFGNREDERRTAVARVTLVGPMHRLALSLTALVVVALAVSGPAVAAQRALWPGVTYERGVQFTPGGPVAISIIRGPRPGGVTTLQPLLSNETLLGRETLTAMQRRAAASFATTAGVNGDYFTLSTGEPSGVLMRESQLQSPPRSSRASAGITSDGTLDIRRVGFFGSWAGAGARRPLATLNEPPADGQVALFTDAYGPATPAVPGATTAVLFPFPAAVPNTDLVATVGLVATGGAPVEIPRGGAVLVGRGLQAAALVAEALVGETVTVRLQLRPEWPGVVAAIGGGPQIVRNGVPVFRSGEAFTSLQLTPRSPRTAVGQTAAGRILLVAVDGRQPGLSIGLSNFELAQALVRLGAVTGMALDGGGSTTMAFDGTVLNSPSDGGERPISTALVLAYEGVFVPDVPARVSPNGDGVDDDARLSVRVVRPSTVTTRVVGPSGLVATATEERQPGSYAIALPAASPTPAGARAEPVQIGRWRLEVAAVDDLGRRSTMARSLVVDDTLGFVRGPRRLLVRNGGRPAVISFRLARDARTTVRVETASGTVVRTLLDAPSAAGPRTVTWDGRSRAGRLLAPSRYVVRVTANGPVGRSEATLPLVLAVAPGTDR